eukprot:3210038-Rhodomonas_salina.1
MNIAKKRVSLVPAPLFFKRAAGSIKRSGTQLLKPHGGEASPLRVQYRPVQSAQPNLHLAIPIQILPKASGLAIDCKGQSGACASAERFSSDDHLRPVFGPLSRGAVDRSHALGGWRVRDKAEWHEHEDFLHRHLTAFPLSTHYIPSLLPDLIA